MNQLSQRIYLKDYTPPPYRVDTVELTFELDPERTVVTNQMRVIRNTGTAISVPLVLGRTSRRGSEGSPTFSIAQM